MNHLNDEIEYINEIKNDGHNKSKNLFYVSGINFISFGFNVLIGIISIIIAILIFLLIRNKNNKVSYNNGTTRKYCTICGSDNPSEAHYCQVCGNSLKT